MRLTPPSRAGIVVVALAVLAAAVGCGGPADDPSADDAAPQTGTPLERLEIPVPTGPPAGLLRGSQDGVQVAFNGGGVSLQLNDLASEEMREALQGSRVTVTCDGAEGSTTWRADSTVANLLVLDAGDRPASCTVSVGSETLVTVALEPLAR